MVFISLFIMLISGALLFWLVAPPAVPRSEENPLHPEEGTLYPPAVKADDLGHLHLQD
ncbi:hypothetical protein [Brevibacillus choshinensis]|uniref:Uncharacterized protein n=1 Tax=Brevibacillus choshinensis TaxID=54911 RepID=A0ABX7FQ31_BRECH|nr:hypothetical protein [Brevibacillus choshinensis]QRG67105.1 hypothetical protein JNE38_27180 [Brevibacillus choshinensis]